MANALIFSQYAQPLRSVQDYSNEMERGDVLRGQNALQAAALQDRQLALQEQERQRSGALAEQNSIQSLLSGASGEDDVIKRLLGSADIGHITRGGALDMAKQKRAKEAADTGKVVADTGKIAAETTDAALKRYRGILDYIDNPQAAARWLQAQYNDPATGQLLSGLAPFEEAVKSIPTTPQEFQQWRVQAGIGMEKVQEFAQKREAEKLRAETQIATNAATNATSRANNAASNATTRRGQDLVNARSIESNSAGKAPPGYRFKVDGALEAIPGGPADIKAGEAGAKKEARTQAASQQAKTVLDSIDRAESMVGYTTAGVGGLLANVPATQARDLRGELETIKANLGFDRLQQMREQSPTGGALGAVAVQELMALQSTVASLDQLRSVPELKNALGKIRKHYQKWESTLESGNGGASGDFSQSDKVLRFDAQGRPIK